MSAPQAIDWSKVEPHYRAGLRSLKDLGGEFGVSDAAIVKHAKKNGWDRDLKAKINAKADAKVSAAMVSAEVSETRRLTEAVRVEVESEVQARIRLEHRKDIAKFRATVMSMEAELELLEEKLPIRAKVLKDLTEVRSRLIALEREAFGLETALVPTAAPDHIEPLDLARRMAFLLTAGTQTLQ